MAPEMADRNAGGIAGWPGALAFLSKRFYNRDKFSCAGWRKLQPHEIHHFPPYVLLKNSRHSPGAFPDSRSILPSAWLRMDFRGIGGGKNFFGER
jgi:hypothetical protein